MSKSSQNILAAMSLSPAMEQRCVWYGTVINLICGALCLRNVATVHEGRIEKAQRFLCFYIEPVLEIFLRSLVVCKWSPASHLIRQ